MFVFVCQPVDNAFLRIKNQRVPSPSCDKVCRRRGFRVYCVAKNDVRRPTVPEGEKMFKTVKHEVWAFDCEWVPDPQAGRILYDLPPATPDRQAVEAMWLAGGATEDDPQPFLKTVFCRVVSIAAVRRTRSHSGDVKVDLLWLPRSTDAPDQTQEKSILSKFLHAIGQRQPQLVGYNSRNADLKILVQRSIANGLSFPEFCRRPDKPWEGVDYFARDNDCHVDLMDIVSSFGKGHTASLNDIATVSGIPGKFDTAGEQVAEMWLNGEWRDVVNYNCFDALTTYLVWLRTAHFAGHFTAPQYEEEQDRVKDMLLELSERPETAFLDRYLEEWDRLLTLTNQI